MRFLLLIFFALNLVSCKNNANDVFLGTWKIDSSSNGPSTKLTRPYMSGTLIIKKDGTYDYDWKADDILGEDRGKYFITDSRNGLKNLRLERKPGYYFYYTILEADKSHFKTSSKHSYTVGDSTIFFDMLDLFKKVKDQ